MKPRELAIIIAGLGLTPKTAAPFVGVCEATIADWLSGATPVNPVAEKLLRLTAFILTELDLTTDEIDETVRTELRVRKSIDP